MISLVLILFMTLWIKIEEVIIFWIGLVLIWINVGPSIETLAYIIWSPLGYILLSLILFLTPIILLSSKDFLNKRLVFITISIILLISLSFLVERLLMFYVYFELRVIPLSIIIIGWGLQPERFRATLYIFLYTILRSFPFIFVLLLANEYNHQIFLFLLIIPFLVKVPVYLVHVWLPKAHVEAPVYGSIFLAAIILKVGIYGIYRIRLYVRVETSFFLRAWSLIGGAFCSLIIIGHTDLKALIAYSRVVHMSCLLGTTLIISKIGILGRICISVAHGVCRSGLFYAVTLQYHIIGRRSIIMASGVLRLLPVLSLIWSFLLITNLRAPPSLRLYREISLFSVWVSIVNIVYFIVAVSILFVLIYSLILFFSLNHGPTVKLFRRGSRSVLINLLLVLQAHWLFSRVLLINWLW